MSSKSSFDRLRQALEQQPEVVDTFSTVEFTSSAAAPTLGSRQECLQEQVASAHFCPRACSGAVGSPIGSRTFGSRSSKNDSRG
jgi:hypothetical protein